VNEGSFDAFVAASGTPLLRTAALLTGDPAAAQDLVQTALVGLHRRWGALADEEQATATARRELVAEHTRRRLWLGDLLADSPLLSGLTGLPGFARQTPAPGPRDELTTALAQLPAELRAAVVLRYGDGLPDPVAAAALACSVEELERRRQQGVTRLADLLGADDASVVGRLRAELGARVAGPAPAGLAERVRADQRDRLRHRAGLAALLGFVLLVVLVVVLTTG
jgi:DNA-directed RNA polymerase specialized sigma24 family protein